MLPYLDGRPLNLHRYPDGARTQGLLAEARPSHTPDWITRWHNDDADTGETEQYLVADSPPALAWLANHGAIELHPWTSRIPDRRPADVGADRHRPGRRRRRGTTA